MSWTPADAPECPQPGTPATVAVEVAPRPQDVGGFAVGRLLPAPARRMVGPFIFLDYMGPARLAPGQGMDVPPHPHIGLATVTYLFAGQALHRDSLGSQQGIQPGDVNWMSAGRGIVHSERTPPEARERGGTLHGVQAWVALPRAAEQTEPRFEHHAAATLPAFSQNGATLRVLAGEAYGHRAPARTDSPLFYVDATLPAGSTVPLPGEYPERAAFIVQGRVNVAGSTAEGPRLLVLHPEADAVLRAETDARVLLLGGEPPEGPHYIWWNFVATSRERIEQAQADWEAGRFPPVAEDPGPPVPLPPGPRKAVQASR